MELILYTSNSTGVASNCLYPNRAVITDPAGLVAAGKFDQVFAKYKDNYRSIENNIHKDSLTVLCISVSMKKAGKALKDASVRKKMPPEGSLF